MEDVEANRDGKKGFRGSRPNTPKKVPGDMTVSRAHLARLLFRSSPCLLTRY